MALKPYEVDGKILYQVVTIQLPEPGRSDARPVARPA